MDVILSGNRTQHLYYLLEFLAAWERRPAYLAPMTYRWCCAISEAAGRLEQREIPITQPRPSSHELERTLERALKRGLGHRLENASETALDLGFKLGLGFGLRLGQQGLALGEGPESLSSMVEAEFPEVGPSCDPFRLDDTSNRAHGDPPGDLTPLDYAHLLSIALEIGFRLATPSPDQETFDLNHTPHYNWVFETAFSSHDDEVVADAVYAWAKGNSWTLPSSCVHYFTERMERDIPFSPRLRQASICAIEDTWSGRFVGLELETIRLLDRLNVDVDDMVEEHKWAELLVDVICPSVGPEGLSPHYWRLLCKLVLSGTLDGDVLFEAFGVEVTRSLEEAEDWEKLEACVAIEWWSLSQFMISQSVEDAEPMGDAESTENAEPVEDVEPTEDLEPVEEDAEWIEDTDPMEDIERLTHILLLQRPSALSKFEDMCETGVFHPECETELRRICDQARVEQSPLESPL